MVKLIESYNIIMHVARYNIMYSITLLSELSYIIIHVVDKSLLRKLLSFSFKFCVIVLELFYS